jgi:hypothetical protein
MKTTTCIASAEELVVEANDLFDLTDLQLALIGGGIGEVVPV